MGWVKVWGEVDAGSKRQNQRSPAEQRGVRGENEIVSSTRMKNVILHSRRPRIYYKINYFSKIEN